MAEMTTFTVPARPESFVLIGMGGTAKVRARYEGGQRVGDLTDDAGVPIRRLTGVAMSVDGVAVDGVTVDTSTPLDDVPAGVIFKASGDVRLTLRADGRAGFGDGGPRGVLVATAYIERLTPAGNVADALKAPAAASSKAGA